MKRVLNFFFGTAFRKGASVLSILTLISYLLGLVRDMVFARTFGASRVLDIYNAAFIIPDLLLNILIAGALTAAFTPVFTHLWSTGEHIKANQTATTVLHGAVFMILAVGGIIWILMPFLSPYIAPGFNAQEMQTLVKVSRLFLLSPLIFAISNTLGNILVSYERFAMYGLSPILYNLGIILGAVFLKKYGVYGVAVGVLIGAFLHFSVRLFAVFKTPFRLHFPLNFKDVHFVKILKLMLPKMIGQPVEQLIFLVFTNIASVLFVGGIAIMNFARNFQSVPVSLFGIAFSTAAFSSLSQKIAHHDKKGFSHHFWETAKWLIIASVLSSVFLFFFGEDVIRIFLGGGKFSPEDIRKTGQMLAVFAFAIPAEAVIHLLSRSFYAFKNTLTPVIVSVTGLIGIVILSKLLAPLFGLIGLALSFLIVLNLEMLILSLLLYWKYQKWHPDKPLS